MRFMSLGAVTALAIVLLTLVPAHATTAEQSAARIPPAPVKWDVPEPFGGAGQPGYSGISWTRGHARLDAQQFQSDRYELRRFDWTKWGKARVVGKGKAHYCDPLGCTPWRRAKVVLFRKRAGYCGDGDTPSHYAYRRYRLSGFVFIDPAQILRSPGVC